MPAGAAPELPAYSPFLARLFAAYLRGYFTRHFHGVRTSGPLPAVDRPLVVYANHPSWWDPIHFFLLAALRLPGLRLYGPMEAAMLEKYAFFRRLGVFGVDATRRGAAAFLRTGRAVLAEPGASLWMTAEGAFTDPRRRPVRLQAGLGHLAARLDDALVVPLAVEYPFWDERPPEALSRFGEAIDLAREEPRSPAAWTERFEGALEATLDALAADAASRDPARFDTVLAGRAGIGGVYDRWRWLLAALRGRSFDAAHGAPAPVERPVERSMQRVEEVR